MRNLEQILRRYQALGREGYGCSASPPGHKIMTLPKIKKIKLDDTVERNSKAVFRKVAFLTCEVSPRRKIKINLPGCNFDCKGCFSIAKKEIGRALSVDGLLDLLLKSCYLIYGGLVDDVQMTGGEPTMNPNYLLSLIQKLRELGVSKIGISTNGHMLSENLVGELNSLCGAGLYIKLDLKAYTDEIHKWYTGKSNINVLRAVRLLHEYNIDFYARTIVIPDIVDASEVGKIAKFLSSIDQGIPYKLYEFAPFEFAFEQFHDKLSRRPTEEKMLKAFNVARKHLNNVEFFIYPGALNLKTSPHKTAYDPDYKFVEIRADELLGSFKRIDKLIKLTDPGWNVQYLTMDQVLS